MTISEVAGLKLYVDIREQILDANSNVIPSTLSIQKDFKIERK